MYDINVLLLRYRFLLDHSSDRRSGGVSVIHLLVIDVLAWMARITVWVTELVTEEDVCQCL